MGIEDEHVLVLGGTSGIGFAAAKALALAGARVTIVGRDPAKAAAAAGEIGNGANFEVFDATSRKDLDTLFANTAPLDHLVLSISSGGGAGAFRELDLDALRRAFDGKFWACTEAIQAALPHLRADGSITIVTAASARMAAPGTSGLAANNGALNAMVAPLALELAPLRVNALCPGVIKTPIFDRWPEAERDAFMARAAAVPVGRMGQPDDIASAIVFLVANSFVTGTMLDCDGGMRLQH